MYCTSCYDDGVSVTPFSHYLLGSGFTLLCFSKDSTAVHQVPLFLLFFSWDGCTHSYIISLPSQTHSHFPCVLLYFSGLAANVCLGLNKVQRYKNRSAGFVARFSLQYLFLCDCPMICLRKIKNLCIKAPRVSFVKVHWSNGIWSSCVRDVVGPHESVEQYKAKTATDELSL